MAITATSSLTVQDLYSTTSAATFSASDTTLYLTSLPNGSEGFLTLFSGTTPTEIVYYTSKGANFVTIPSATQGAGRGMGGTTPTAFNSGTTVKQTVNADFWKELQNGHAWPDGVVLGKHLGTAAIKLGRTSITSNITTTATSVTQATGLTQAVTIPSGGRDVRVSCYLPEIQTDVVPKRIYFELWDGVVSSGTRIGKAVKVNNVAATGDTVYIEAYVTPASGAKTYNLGWYTDAATTATMVAAATAPAYIKVELS